MTKRAVGTFEVSVKPLDSADEAGASSLGRMSLDKQFSGDLCGVGNGEMLTAMAPTKGSGAYVAIERVTGTLHGRKGGFVFQHAGTMQGAAQQMTITVVPDSGVGDLAGITGTFVITIAEGKHSYVFDYAMPA